MTCPPPWIMSAMIMSDHQVQKIEKRMYHTPIGRLPLLMDDSAG